MFNVLTIEIEIGPSFINKQDRDMPVTAIGPRGWGYHTYMGGIFQRKISRCKVFFLSHACKLNKENQKDVSKVAANIKPITAVFPLTGSWQGKADCCYFP